jgi:hypothetical protein
LKNMRTVICLGNTWTARRYPMTLHRHWPEVEKMLLTVDNFRTPRSLWYTHPEPLGVARVGQDRGLQGERLYRGLAELISSPVNDAPPVRSIWRNARRGPR